MPSAYLICIGLEVATEVQSTSAEKEDGQGTLGGLSCLVFCWISSAICLAAWPPLPHCCIVGAGAVASGVGP